MDKASHKSNILPTQALQSRQKVHFEQSLPSRSQGDPRFISSLQRPNSRSSHALGGLQHSHANANADLHQHHASHLPPQLRDAHHPQRAMPADSSRANRLATIREVTRDACTPHVQPVESRLFAPFATFRTSDTNLNGGTPFNPRDRGEVLVPVPGPLNNNNTLLPADISRAERPVTTHGLMHGTYTQHVQPRVRRPFASSAIFQTSGSKLNRGTSFDPHDNEEVLPPVLDPINSSDTPLEQASDPIDVENNAQRSNMMSPDVTVLESTFTENDVKGAAAI